jgi:hypothetical protein
MRRQWIFSFFIFVLTSMSFGVMPIVRQSVLTFYSNGGKPKVSWPLRVTETADIEVLDAANIQKVIKGIEIRGDSLLLFTAITKTPDGIVRYADTVFNRSGIYQAFEIPVELVLGSPGPIRLSLGQFRVLPKMETTPMQPISSQAIQLKLVLGVTHSACPPVYQSSITQKGNLILLQFSEILGRLAPCPAIYIDPPVGYGPVFDLGKLSAGKYAITIEDSITVDTLWVNQAIPLKGTAMIMQSPYIKSMPRPVPGAQIVAYPAPSCPPIFYYDPYMIQKPETLRTMTDAYGAFSLTFSSGIKMYEICAIKAGYHPQIVYFLTDTGKSVSFEMFPSTQKPIADLQILVTDKGTPVANAQVTLYGGTLPVYCPATLAKAAYQRVEYFGNTDVSGKLIFSSMSLSPYIDYMYLVRSPGGTKFSHGTVRLNAYIINKLNVDLNATGVIPLSHNLASTGRVQVIQQSFDSKILIRWNEGNKPDRIWISDIRGRKIDAIKNIMGDSYIWDSARFPNGIYIVKANFRGQTESNRVLISR